MKIRLVGAELFHAERRTDGQMERDMAKLILAFRSISNAPDKKHRNVARCTLLFKCFNSAALLNQHFFIQK